MKIIHVLNSGNPGGMEQHVLDIVLGMVKLGHEVYVWCTEGDMVELYKKAGATVTIKSMKMDIDPFYIYSLAKFLKSKKIDIIHGHELQAVTNSIFAGLLSGVPVIISHTHTPISEWKTPNIFKKIFTIVEYTSYAILINLFSSKEIALTESRKKVKIQEGMFPSKIEIIPNGINVDKFKISNQRKNSYKREILRRYKLPENAIIFGNVSRLTEEKGHEELIRGFAEFLRFPISNKEDFYLLIAGGGKLEKDLRKLARELEINDNVIITGMFDDEDKIKFYSSFDVFVFPSLAEGFGIVLIEAMCTHTPVLCSDIPVLKEVGGDTIKYFKAGDYKDLASKMEEIYNELSFEKYDAKKAQDRVIEMYSMENFIKAYEDLYTKLLENKQ